jgi:ubiquinone/menaquinone biosynthesis C-methylase UbiE
MQEKEIENIRFARSVAERLPFSDGVFDRVTCSGALHLFQDTAEALREMTRVMKNGPRLAAETLVKGDPFTFKMILERLGASNLFDGETVEVLHIFDVEEFGNYLSQTGFKGFTYNIYGFLYYSPQKKDKIRAG